MLQQSSTTNNDANGKDSVGWSSSQQPPSLAVDNDNNNNNNPKNKKPRKFRKIIHRKIIKTVKRQTPTSLSLSTSNINKEEEIKEDDGQAISAVPKYWDDVKVHPPPESLPKTNLMIPNNTTPLVQMEKDTVSLQQQQLLQQNQQQQKPLMKDNVLQGQPPPSPPPLPSTPTVPEDSLPLKETEVENVENDFEHEHDELVDDEKEKETDEKERGQDGKKQLVDRNDKVVVDRNEDAAVIDVESDDLVEANKSFDDGDVEEEEIINEDVVDGTMEEEGESFGNYNDEIIHDVLATDHDDVMIKEDNDEVNKDEHEGWQEDPADKLKQFNEEGRGEMTDLEMEVHAEAASPEEESAKKKFEERGAEKDAMEQKKEESTISDTKQSNGSGSMLRSLVEPRNEGISAQESQPGPADPSATDHTSKRKKSHSDFTEGIAEESAPDPAILASNVTGVGTVLEQDATTSAIPKSLNVSKDSTSRQEIADGKILSAEKKPKRFRPFKWLMKGFGNDPKVKAKERNHIQRHPLQSSSPEPQLSSWIPTPTENQPSKVDLSSVHAAPHPAASEYLASENTTVPAVKEHSTQTEPANNNAPDYVEGSNHEKDKSVGGTTVLDDSYHGVPNHNEESDIGTQSVDMNTSEEVSGKVLASAKDSADSSSNFDRNADRMGEDLVTPNPKFDSADKELDSGVAADQEWNNSTPERSYERTEDRPQPSVTNEVEWEGAAETIDEGHNTAPVEALQTGVSVPATPHGVALPDQESVKQAMAEVGKEK